MNRCGCFSSETWSAAAGGRVTFTDVHVSNMATPTAAYPNECLPITDTEKVLMYQLFDVPPC